MDFEVSEGRTIKDFVFNVNQYKEQHVLEETVAVANMFLNLLYMKPNSSQKAPDMGFDIKGKIHKLDKPNNIIDMNQELEKQCMTYIPGVISSIKIKSEGNGDVLVEAVTYKDERIHFTIDEDDADNITISLPQKDN